MFLYKTITSLVTAPITQNIALIRISGSQTYPIINQVFDRPLPEYPQKKPQLIFGKIVNSQKEIIDEVLLLCFYKPNSFTGEDVVEISCHGNLFVVNQILQLIQEKGAELAKEGEFTKQAFFNGKLNLIQANSINDLIRAPSLEGVKLALHNLSPKSQQKLADIENELLDIIATIKVNIDYPEYDGVEYLTGKAVLPRLNKLLEKLNTIKKDGQKARFYQEGLKVAIVGKPNVGKSTLLNALLQEEKAIVSPVAGTTRDIIEARYNLNGIPLTLLDTAGIHETQDIVEKIGVTRSYQALEKADIIFFLVDNSRSWDKKDSNIYQKIKEKNFLLIINKIDELSKLKFPSILSAKKVCRISAKNQQLGELEKEIKELFASDLINNLSPYPYLSQNVACGDLETSYKLVKELSGKEYNEDLLDIIFTFGNHTVRSLLNSPYFNLKKILLREEHKKDRNLLQLLAQKKIPYELLNKEQFSRYSFDKKSQGIVAFIRSYHYVPLASLLTHQPQRRFPLIVMLDSIEDPHNFGAILRTGAALAIDGVIIAKKNQVPVNSTVIKISMGGVAQVPVCQVNSMAETINQLKIQGYKIISTLCQPGTQTYNKFAFAFPTCLIFGNEHEGIRPSLVKKSDYSIYIPMSNNIGSLNVSVSCGVILAEVVSQWEKQKK
ncbi:10955_t:CDS:2 [Ambispora leptoticha]|uniref:10955_t:CDS:1 n=1 Tax=Ambispora leptoticha TaxID=144679 RepID=A0A9N8VFJ6_9GLOM|nr:10955_t:CDS:2 [Ambispora leptoticha]